MPILNYTTKEEVEQFKAEVRDRAPDGYWIRMGGLAVEALSDVIREDLTPRCREIVAEYLGGIMDNAYYMGIRLGQLSARSEQLQSSQQQIKK